MLKNIIVAIDGSDHATKALKVACDLVQHYDGQINLVHTPEIATTSLAVGSGAVEIPPTDEAIAEVGRAVMAEAATTVCEACKSDHARRHPVSRGNCRSRGNSF